VDSWQKQIVHPVKQVLPMQKVLLDLNVLVAAKQTSLDAAIVEK